MRNKMNSKKNVPLISLQFQKGLGIFGLLLFSIVAFRSWEDKKCEDAKYEYDQAVHNRKTSEDALRMQNFGRLPSEVTIHTIPNSLNSDVSSKSSEYNEACKK
jgi:hypothetical protein